MGTSFFRDYAHYFTNYISPDPLLWGLMGLMGLMGFMGFMRLVAVGTGIQA